MTDIKTDDKQKIKRLSTYGLALFLFLTPFEYPLAAMTTISPLRIVGLLAMGLAVLDIFIQKKGKLDYRVISLALWLLYGFMSSYWALDNSRFSAFYSIYLNNALMFVLFAMVKFSKYEVNILKKSMVFGVGALFLYMIFVPDAVAYSSYQHRLTLNAGTVDLDQNYLAALMMISFGIVFYNMCNVKQKIYHKIISVVFCILVVCFVVLTGSRSGLLALAFIALLCVNASWKTLLYVGIPLILVVLLAIPYVAEHLSTDLLERFSMAAMTGQEGESESRLLIWERAIESLQDFKWVFGHGIGSSQTIVGDVLKIGKEMVIHNHYIAMLVEVGIVGFLLINVPIFKMVFKAWKNNKETVIGFCGVLFMAIFLDVLTTKFFWSAMILISACCSVRDESE